MLALIFGTAETAALVVLWPRIRGLLGMLGPIRMLAEVATIATSVLLLVSVLADPARVVPRNLALGALPALAFGLLVTSAAWTTRRPAGLSLRSGIVPVLVGTFAGLTAISVAVLLATFGGDRLHSAHGIIVILTLVSLWTREVLRGRQSIELMRQLSDQASTDPLTGLGNRRALAAAMDQAFAAEDRRMAVLTIDLDHFKRINTLLGHHIGDELLVAVASALQAESEGPGRAFRLGGDEFAVLVPDPGADVPAIAARMMARIDGLMRTVPGAGQVDVSASIGIAHQLRSNPATEPGGDLASDSGNGDPAVVLNHSEDAMRAAKAAGRARVVTYDGAVAQRQQRREALERRLRLAVAQDQIRLWLQPIISLPEMRMVGAESLARWNDEELGDVSPAEFIPVAEDCGLIIELGMQLARRSMHLWQDTGAHGRQFNGGVNVSVAQLRMPDFAARIAGLLDEIGVEPARFVLEITESMHIEDDDPAGTTLWQLAEIGLPIAIDDFGTGYSSLSLISQLPVRVLKLDRSLTQQLDDVRGQAIARCVTEMAKSLGIDVVAEGIETAEHLEAIRRLGVGFGQGWLFSRAVPPETFTEFVRDPSQVLAHLSLPEPT